jgi:L-iditol 2-dehydrogenase/L-gulonate 5-dehydrogenase
MRAALLVAPSKIEVHDVNEPIVGRNEVKIKPIRAGICGTDVSLFLGHRTAISYPLILGHELVARVVAVGEDVRNIKVGQRVVVEPNYPCGKCGVCLSGRGNICSKKQSMGVTVPGCFADCVTAPSEFVWPLPDSVSDSDAATIEPLTVSLHALFQSRARIGDTIAVLGCGVIGLLLIHAAVRQGIRVLAHDKIDEKVQFARRLGAITDGSKELKDLWEAEGVVAVFECAGAAATVDLR